jgi:endonuclease YncB( thermonuclease family)
MSGTLRSISAVCLCLTAYFWSAANAAAEEVRGVASIKSGNEIVIGKRIVRLFGVQAPKIDEICQIEEAKMKCGIVAWSQLIQLADGWHVSCDIELKSKQGSDFATCYIGEIDLNEGMVRSGWAKAARKQTDRYIVDEEDARASKRGLWTESNTGG